MAAGLAAELKESVGVDAELVKGSGGIYQVHMDGDLIFDKREVGRYPILGEVTDLVQDARSRA